jgi:hypothetical protein
MRTLNALMWTSMHINFYHLGPTSEAEVFTRAFGLLTALFGHINCDLGYHKNVFLLTNRC